MNKARKEIEKALPQVDLIIEVLDARIPFSSENPMIAQFTENKPCIKVFNKSDLADPSMTQVWQQYYEKQQHVKTLATRMDEPDKVRQISRLCKQMFPERENSFKPIHTMIMGIPNVGKSTIINLLTGQTIAKTGNEPAITKSQQRIRLDNGITLSDTPGVLWPNVENKNSGYRLATTGAIKDTAMDYADVAFFAINYFSQICPERLISRYELDFLPSSELEMLEAIGKKRGCLSGGGLVDLDKVSKIILKEFRSGMLGSITLETPEMMLQEIAETAQIREEKAKKKEARLAARKKRRS
jgi:ribosome biogenesis GTPase A